ncbi:hypothetical protein BABINDRAFT_159839 [Babjeviella inositovora NRRL Y-12698]|uniref:Ketoreductase domain-containing protein n=1 Tax=Babjeviella inositovora NRRL Y-12698 TaxID=984486 RepID=A0A1E3QVB2_9ASCO|nr:uncharacterized protein BABINDRAFT_159839 [Babjeviella inositovora NRRL Y-12698]ODQ81564.1 hypothetical protein BABINDRAFT_159839 [Babjeviella inositovora NRRL Y-12698]
MSYGSSAASRLANKVVLITGASAGIGEATAQEFAEAAKGQVKLILTARRKDKLDALKDELTKQYPNIQVLTVELDVSEISTIVPFVEKLPAEFKEIDILVNNAGKAQGVDRVGDIAMEDIEVMINTNVLGLFTLTQAVVPGMQQRNRGDIVNLGSIAGRDPYPGGGIYCASKAAIRSFSHSLRKELINTRIRVLEIDPGNVETDFSINRFGGDISKAKLVYAGTEPLVAVDVAELVLFACTRKENTEIAEQLVFSTNQASAFHLFKQQI